MRIWSLATYTFGALRGHAGSTVASLLAIALGVALGVAVSAVNRSALDEFNRGLRALTGAADLEVRGGRSGFDEALYAALLALPEIETASPVVEVTAKVPGAAEPLRMIGIDPLQAGRLASLLLPGGGQDEGLRWLAPDAVFLSPSAAVALSLREGGELSVQVGVAERRFRVAGMLPGVPASQRLAVLDIATAQWRLDFLGRLTRIDVALRKGVSLGHAAAAIGRILPPGVSVAAPDQAEARQSELSRAYRVNLDMLALIALLTGAFLVFSTQALSVIRRRAELAFLRAAGVTRSGVAALLLAEGLAIGLAGGAAGVALGYALAGVALRMLGADLGAGYFPGAQPPLAFDFGSAAAYLLLGVAAATAGAVLPALEAARSPPARALRSGDEQRMAQRATRIAPGLGALGLGAAFAAAPSVDDLPVFGYASVTLLLLGSVMLVPWLAHAAFRWLPEGRRIDHMLAVSRLRHAPGQAIAAGAGIVASVALASAMAIMVSSFRDSLGVWLDRVLPADLYVRVGRPGETGFVNESEQAVIRRLPGVEKADFIRHDAVLLDPARPPASLIARDVPVEAPGSILALVASAPALAPDDAGLPPAWASEAMADLYGYRLGDSVRIPIGGALHAFRVMGIWRDYARQHGAVVIRAADYRRITGDDRASEAALWLGAGVTAADIRERLRSAFPGAERMELAEPGQIRAVSLVIFDRTFAVTYALEAVAVVIGLFGVAASFAAAAQMRRREFGMLRHIGVTRAEVARMIAWEGALVAALGVAAGFAAGGLISLVLVHVVNRQSFHWSMDMSIPWESAAVFGASVVASAALTAVVAARSAMQRSAVRAVREDW